MVAPINQGNLNRLRGSVVYADLPALGVTTPFLAKEAISITFEGDAGHLLPTLTGGVGSPEPYQIATVEIHLLKTQALANAYKNQVETNNRLGSVNVIGDAETMESWQLENCQLLTTAPGAFDGQNPTFVVRLQGIYYTNRDLWTSS